MALYKPGAGVVQISGSISGSVFARNRFGNYIRPRTKPVNPRSQRQMAIRTILMFLAEQWHESPMTDLIRTAWQTYADSVNWVNRLGEQVTLTGFNVFLAGNAARITAGGSLVTAAPAALGLPAGDPVFQISAVSAAAQTYTATFDDTMDWNTEAGAYMIFYQGKPVSASHTFFGGPWRQCYGFPGVDPGGSPSPVIGFAQNGFPFVEGQKIWWQARIVRADGRASNPFRCDPTIVAA